MGTIIHTTNSWCVLYIKADVANMADAWFIHRPVWLVRGLYRPAVRGLYKPHTGQCMSHAPAILAAPAVCCIHGHVIHQASGHQTFQNVNEKHTIRIGCHSKHTSSVKLVKLVILYNETAFPVDYEGENEQQ